MPFEVRCFKNLDWHEGDTASPRYFFEVDLGHVLPGEGRIAHLPVYWRPNPGRHPILKEVYWTPVAALRVEKGNLAALERAVPETVASLVEHGTLPYYYVTTPQGDFPAYLVRGRLLLKLETATFTGRDIGELWQQLADYLMAARKIGAREEVTVSLLLWKDLQVYPAALALRDGRVWLPLFRHGEGDSLRLIYDVIGQPSRFLGVEELFGLRREVAQSLMEARAIPSLGALKVDQMQPEVWERLQPLLRPTPYVLAYEEDGQRRELPVYEAAGEFVALQRASHARLIFAADLEELARLVYQDLAQRGAVGSPSLLTLEQRRR